jgi:hypothetical protein
MLSLVNNRGFSEYLQKFETKKYQILKEREEGNGQHKMQGS